MFTQQQMEIKRTGKKQNSSERKGKNKKLKTNR